MAPAAAAAVVSVRCPVAAARLRSGERALTITYRKQVGCSRCGLCEHDQIMGLSDETAGPCSCAAGTSLVTIIAAVAIQSWVTEQLLWTAAVASTNSLWQQQQQTSA
jgi:hypothetical protein